MGGRAQVFAGAFMIGVVFVNRFSTSWDEFWEICQENEHAQLMIALDKVFLFWRKEQEWKHHPSSSTEWLVGPSS